MKFYAGKAALGLALITLVAIDANRNVDTASITININTLLEPNIEILTFGVGVSLTDPTVKASGRVYDVNLDEYKPVVYVKTDKYYAMPYHDQGSPHNKGMKSIWVNKEGYWWTKITHSKNFPGELHCWLVDRDWPPPDIIELWEPSPDRIAEANTLDMDVNDYYDGDNDLLPDDWEKRYFGCINLDRYDDSDGDFGNNLEEFLRKTDPTEPNDNDKDGLWDNWEQHFFGDVDFYDANDDPDGDGLNNMKELNLGLHPGRTAVDKDRDGLPDLWEIHWFNNLTQNTKGNPDFDGCNNLDEYEVGLNPVFPDLGGDFDCDCDVDLYDLALFVKQWLEPRLSADIAPELPDGRVDFLDWAVFAKAWRSTSATLSLNWNEKCDIAPDGGDGEVNWYDVGVFVEQWLGAYYGDIAPDGGDDMVNLLDFATLAENWLLEL